jgi:site-specific recombinase XerD
VSPRTAQTYTESARQLAAFLAEQGMPQDVVNIHREHVEAFIADLLERWKPATAHNRWRGCQAFFKWAVDEGEISESPMARMRPPRVPEQPVPILTEAQLKAFLATCERDRNATFEDRRDAAIIRCFLSTGARRAEIAGLRWRERDPLRNDVDLDGRRLRVFGKGRRERLVPLDPSAVKALDRYIRVRAKHAAAKRPELWLSSIKSAPLTDSGIAQMMRRRSRQAGIPEVHPHQLRHTYAHLMLSRGMQEGDLMRLGGWRSTRMIHERYGAIAAADRALAAADRLNDEGEL